MPNAQAARVSAPDETPGPFLEQLFVSEAAAGERPGQRHTVVVQTVFRGVVTGARVLPAPGEVQRSASARPLSLAGAALCFLALATFVTIAAKGVVDHEPLLADVVFFGGLLVGGVLLAMGLHRRRQGQAHEGADFLVGSAAGVDAPVDPRYVPAPAHRLVTTLDDGYVVHATPRMEGEIIVAGEVFSLDELARRQGPALRFPPGGCARLSCGESTFIVASIVAPVAIARPVLRWQPHQDGYTLGAGLVLALFLMMIFSVPPDRRSLSLDLFGNESHLLRFRIAPPVEDVPLTPTVLTTAASAAGKAGKAPAGELGQLGDRASKARDHRYAVKGPPENRDLRLAKEVAIEGARTAGILGVFKRLEGGPVASIFAREAALGDAAEDVLGNLIGPQIGSSWGSSGLGAHGTGAGGGDTGKGTLGVAHLGTIGGGTGADGEGPGRYGQMAGMLHRRKPIVPEILPGIADVRGSLDKEIIRRTIRRHINEIKFCYEAELTKRPELGGRILVQFAIAGSGQVISSVLQNSTMGNPRVENCTVQAVKRWPFPQPKGGGLVMVTYPFVLAPAGS